MSITIIKRLNKIELIYFDFWCLLISIKKVHSQCEAVLNVQYSPSPALAPIISCRCQKYIIFNDWKLMYSNGSYCTCNNLWFGRILNDFKIRLRVKVLLMEINEHYRSKEKRHSHDSDDTNRVSTEPRMGHFLSDIYQKRN